MAEVNPIGAVYRVAVNAGPVDWEAGAELLSLAAEAIEQGKAEEARGALLTVMTKRADF